MNNKYRTELIAKLILTPRNVKLSFFQRQSFLSYICFFFFLDFPMEISSSADLDTLRISRFLLERFELVRIEDNVTPRVVCNIRSEGVIKIDAEGLLFLHTFILLGRKRRLRDALRRILYPAGRCPSATTSFHLPWNVARVLA